MMQLCNATVSSRALPYVPCMHRHDDDDDADNDGGGEGEGEEQKCFRHKVSSVCLSPILVLASCTTPTST